MMIAESGGRERDSGKRLVRRLRGAPEQTPAELTKREGLRRLWWPGQQRALCGWRFGAKAFLSGGEAACRCGGVLYRHGCIYLIRASHRLLNADDEHRVNVRHDFGGPQIRAKATPHHHVHDDDVHRLCEPRSIQAGSPVMHSTICLNSLSYRPSRIAISTASTNMNWTCASRVRPSAANPSASRFSRKALAIASRPARDLAWTVFSSAFAYRNQVAHMN